MPTNKPRINVTLEKTTYEAIRELARKEGISISLEARDLLHDALEVHEDLMLDKIASKRERALNRKNLLSHKEVWSD